MADSVRNVILRITSRGGDEAKRALSGISSESEKLTKAVKVSTAAIAATGAALSAITVQALKNAQEIEGVSNAFDQLQAKAGLLANQSLADLREQTRGLVSDFGLMQQANQAAQLGLDPSTFDELAGAAIKLGAAVGQDATTSIESATAAVGRNSFEMLDNLGIILRVEEAHRIHAEQLGKTTQQLTEVEKAEAFRVVATQKIIEAAGELADVEETAAIALERVTVASENAWNEFSTGISQSEALRDSLNQLAEAIAGIDWKAVADDAATVFSVLADGIDIVARLGENWQWMTDRISAGTDAFRQANLGQIQAARSQDELNKLSQQYTDELIEVRQRIKEVTAENESYWFGSAELTEQLEVLNAQEQALKKSLLDVESAMIDVGQETVTTTRTIKEATEAVQEFSAAGGAAPGTPSIISATRLQPEIEAVGQSLQQEFITAGDVFETAVTGAINGDITDAFINLAQRVAVRFGSNLVDSIFSGGGLGGIFGGGAPGVPTFPGQGAAGGGFLGGLTTAGAGIGAGLLVQNSISGIQTLANGGSLSGGENAALALQTGGFSLALNAFDFGSGKSPEQQHRDAVRDQLQSTGLLFDADRPHSFNLFGGGVGSLSPGGDNTGRNSNAGLQGLGELLETGLGFGGDDFLGNMFANALEGANSFNAAILTTQGLLEQAGVSAEDLGSNILSLALDGELSIAEMNEQLNALNTLMMDDLAGATADVDAGLQLLADTAGGPLRDQVKAAELAFNEFRQAGIQDGQALVSFIQDRLGPDSAAAIERMIEHGIDQFTNFNDLSTQELQALINLIGDVTDAVGNDLANAGQSAGEAIASGASVASQNLTTLISDAEGARRALDEAASAADNLNNKSNTTAPTVGTQ